MLDSSYCYTQLAFHEPVVYVLLSAADQNRLMCNSCIINYHPLTTNIHPDKAHIVALVKWKRY